MHLALRRLLRPQPVKPSQAQLLNNPDELIGISLVCSVARLFQAPGPAFIIGNAQPVQMLVPFAVEQFRMCPEALFGIPKHPEHIVDVII